MKKTKILGALVIIVLGGLAYLALKSSQQAPKGPEAQKTEEVGGAAEELELEKKPQGPKKLLYRQNLTRESSPHPGKQVVKLWTIDLESQDKKLVFTDIDEDFQIKIVDGVFKDLALIFATILNETTGSLWEIAIDGSGSKTQIIEKFTASSFAYSGQKIAFVSYDNIKGVYALWVMDPDGRFKTKILESETAISDPVFVSDYLALIRVTKEGNGTINTVNLDGSSLKEIKNAKDDLIYSLSSASNKLAYIKSPKSGGQENQAEVYICDIDGQNEKRITEDNQADGYPILSKDGSKIAFYKAGKIWLSNVDGSGQKALVEGSQPIAFLD